MYLIENYQLSQFNDFRNIVNNYSTNMYTLTQDMKNQFFDRTANHIILYKLYYENYYNKQNVRPKKMVTHDFSKFQEPELGSYIATTWNYYCKDHNIKFEISAELQRVMNEATEHHVKTNSHHPEYWLKDKTRQTIPTNDRDKFDPSALPVIDVSDTMTYEALVEMCADWCAMSKERHNTPFEWANKVINTRWKFGEEKEIFIYKVLNQMWIN